MTIERLSTLHASIMNPPETLYGDLVLWQEELRLAVAEMIDYTHPTRKVETALERILIESEDFLTTHRGGDAAPSPSQGYTLAWNVYHMAKNALLSPESPKLLPRQKSPETLERPEQITEIIRLRAAINDFITAVDRGDFSQTFLVGPSGERVESAFVAALREAVGR